VQRSYSSIDNPYIYIYREREREREQNMSNSVEEEM
jgi:hypothetical protein